MQRRGVHGTEKTCKMTSKISKKKKADAEARRHQTKKKTIGGGKKWKNSPRNHFVKKRPKNKTTIPNSLKRTEPANWVRFGREKKERR